MAKFFIRYKPYLIFVFVFSVVFFIIQSYFVYLFPFIFGLVVSFIMYPVYKFMKKKLSFKPAFSATVISLFIFAIIISIIMFLLYLLVSELINIYNNNREFINMYISDLDLSSIFSDLNIDGDFFSKMSDTAFNIVKIVPVFLTLIIISFAATVYIINSLPDIKNLIECRLSENNAFYFNKIVCKSKDIFKKFIKSYLLLYTLTFIESIFIFALINLDYIIVFAFLTAFFDILPILGPGAIYFPLAIVKVVSGDFLSCITLLIFWAITVIIRQILEPKILSDNIKIHPLVILSALYFSIVSSKIWVLFYVLSFTIVYKILIESQVLSPIFEIRENIGDKDC